MDSSGITIPTYTGDTQWGWHLVGQQQVVRSLPDGIVGPLCTLPLKTVHFSANFPPPTATSSTNTRTYCCLIIGMFTQLAAATAAKGTQRATRGGAFCRKRKKKSLVGFNTGVLITRDVDRHLGSMCMTFFYCYTPSFSLQPIYCKSWKTEPLELYPARFTCCGWS